MNRRFSYAKNTSWGVINEEVFVFNETNGYIYLFKDLYKDVWLSIHCDNCVTTIISLLSKSNNTEEKELKNKVNIIIDNMFHKKLLIELK